MFTLCTCVHACEIASNRVASLQYVDQESQIYLFFYGIIEGPLEAGPVLVSTGTFERENRVYPQ